MSCATTGIDETITNARVKFMGFVNTQGRVIILQGGKNIISEDEKQFRWTIIRWSSWFIDVVVACPNQNKIIYKSEHFVFTGHEIDNMVHPILCAVRSGTVQCHTRSSRGSKRRARRPETISPRSSSKEKLPNIQLQLPVWRILLFQRPLFLLFRWATECNWTC